MGPMGYYLYWTLWRGCPSFAAARIERCRCSRLWISFFFWLGLGASWWFGQHLSCLRTSWAWIREETCPCCRRGWRRSRFEAIGAESRAAASFGTAGKGWTSGWSFWFWAFWASLGWIECPGGRHRRRVYVWVYMLVSSSKSSLIWTEPQSICFDFKNENVCTFLLAVMKFVCSRNIGISINLNIIFLLFFFVKFVIF